MTVGGLKIARASFFSTHHASASDALTGRTRQVAQPAYPLLVARARRFTSLVTQLHMEVCGAVGGDVGAGPEGASVARMPGVFATCHGEIQTAEALISDLFTSEVVSSARFALSVHNTAAGLYSVATANMEPTTTIAGANAMAAAWLEAALLALDTGKATLLSIADEPVPVSLRGPSSMTGVAAAFVLLPSTTDSGEVELSFVPSHHGSDAAPDALRTLACVVDAAQRDDAAMIPLGPIRPGHVLELRRRPTT